MPSIYDNHGLMLLDGLRSRMQRAVASDFCVGYFNLRGWDQLAELAEGLQGGDGRQVRLLVGMQRPPEEQMRELARAAREERPLDPPALKRLKQAAAGSFRQQLDFGVPTEEAERSLRRLVAQIRAQKVRVKLFLPYPLHAKLYLVQGPHEEAAPLVGFVGSSNLTLAGLKRQGELNVDVLDQDAAEKLRDWFEQHWEDKHCVDISEELVKQIENSWARQELLDPYLVYLKMVFHLSREARVGEREFKLPTIFEGQLLDFQTAAVSLAAHHLHQRGGVLLADVVGLGKTIMATAIAKIMQEDQGWATLIVCPRNLVTMWEEYRRRYELSGEVLSLSMVSRRLPDLKRYKLLIIDESHNLRNREGRRYQALRDYIERNEPYCLLLTATPYNKQYLDIANQLRLFLDDHQDLGIRPERYFAATDEADFAVSHQAPSRSIVAFEKSHYPEDWRDILRLYMVRRTRDFIIQNYAKHDAQRDRHYLEMPDGTRSYFPKRNPKTVVFAVDASDPNDQYAQLYREEVVETINGLMLPRYGLANYIDPVAVEEVSGEQKQIVEDLTRAGKRLMGFCRTNLFKRLESNGQSFLLSLHRHILRSLIALHALQEGLDIPIGTQDSAMLDGAFTDEDRDAMENEDGPEEDAAAGEGGAQCWELSLYHQWAGELYDCYRSEHTSRYKWLPARFFAPELRKHLLADARALHTVLCQAVPWQPDRDPKLNSLEQLLRKHRKDKVLIFTQFADTAKYLERELRNRGLERVAAVTASHHDPTSLAFRFSPRSNEYDLKTGEQELQVLVATDVLSEGQNLQDAHIVVNFDLPWAIIRLIQRAGRLDRIGQLIDTIKVYSFLPADGIERVIRLQARLTQRLLENQEVVGIDEQFLGEASENRLRGLYAGDPRALEDEDAQGEVDLVSAALQMWNSAPDWARAAAEKLPPISHATRPHEATPADPAGVLTYLRLPEGPDMMVRVDRQGRVVSQSLSAVLNAAACPPETPALERQPNHYDLVEKSVLHALSESRLSEGRLGTKRAVRRRVYERLKSYYERLRLEGSLWATPVLDQAINAIFSRQLTSGARDALGRQLRLGINEEMLAEMVTDLHASDRLCLPQKTDEGPQEPEIICSMGLSDSGG